MQIPVFSVSEFTALVNATFEHAFSSVIIEGEVSGFKLAKNNYIFFDLKDEVASLNCFMTVYQMKMPIEDGMVVRVHAIPKLLNWGKFSLTVRAVELVGEGALQRAAQLLHKKLEGEGLFDEQRKRPLPAYPTRIGLITSAGSAAAADFVKIANSRWFGLDIALADVLVQGIDSPDQIIKAIDYFNQAQQPVEVLVLIRGGGSTVDLSAFSTEPVVRAVAGSRIPTLVAIGHENDQSLAELVADLQASTPSNAAELLVPDKVDVLRSIKGQQKWLLSHIDTLMTSLLNKLQQGLSQLELFAGFDSSGRQLALAKSALNAKLSSRFEVASEKLKTHARILGSFDPKAVLRRGYSVVRSSDRIVKDSRQLKLGGQIMVELAHGELGAKVTKIQ